MKEKLVDFFRVIFPFLLTVGLWRLSGPVWNPAGVLAIIPIFFCSFVKPCNWFHVFSIIMCFCLDYKFNTVCFWVAMYCLFYAINGFQSLIDIERMDKNALNIFMIFFGTAILILFFTNITLENVLRTVWMFAEVVLLYLPITSLIKRVHND